MKTLLLTLALACSVTPLMVSGQTGPSTFQSMKIHATELPPFPATLVARGVTSGLARVVVRIDHTGALDEWIVTGYSHQPFATGAVDAIQRWKFTPAVFAGEPVSAQAELTFDFRADGVVISQNMTEHFLDLVTRQGGGPPLVYQPCSVRELDRIPTPVNVVSPHYSEALALQGVTGEVTVEFFIDEQGRVRMPVVGRDEQHELAALAIEAVRQWSFEPPTRRGRPVLVQARQHFRFVPAAAAAATEPPVTPAGT